MGELADDFRYMKEERLKHRQSVEPNRFQYATGQLIDAGHRVAKDPTDDKCLIVNGYIKFWPFTDWYSGKGIGSGRGIKNLLKQLAPTHK